MNRRSGFTLVEILIVVVILGILAAIVIPQFTNASESAKASNLKSQLQTLRSQLELYQVQHNGDYPAADASSWSWDKLTKKTNVAGTVEATGDFGPYLQGPPINPLTGSSDVAAGVSATAGWQWDGSSMKAQLPADKSAEDYGLAAGDVASESGT